MFVGCPDYTFVHDRGALDENPNSDDWKIMEGKSVVRVK